MRRYFILPVCLLALYAGEAMAAPDAQNDDSGGDFAVVGVGLASIPDHSGSAHRRIVPVPGAVGRIGGHKFHLLGNLATIDLIAEKPGPGWDLQLGPVASVGLDRTSSKGIADPRIRALGTVGTSVELGGYVGISRQGVFTRRYDRVSFNVNWRHDVAGGHGGTIISPTLSYLTPLNRGMLVSAFVSATHVDRHYADTYFTVTPAQSAASGLPAFSARPGWKNWSVGAATMISLGGDLSHGFSLAGGVAYSRLINDYAQSPVVRIAGSRNQLMAGLGLAYTF